MAVQRVIGIDFGTSTSVVRVKRYQDGKPVDDKLFTKAVTFNMGATMVPTLVRKTDNGTYFGYEAEVNKKNSMLYQSFKMDLESEDSEQKDTARILTAEYLKYLEKVYREQSDGGHLGDPSDEEKTFISYPVKWSNETKEFMLASARAAGFHNVVGMNEAEAAIHAVTLQNEDLLKKKGYLIAGKPVHILLLDMGAGTSDLVLCRHTPGDNEKTEIICAYPKDGEILFGGREVDGLLGQYIAGQVPDEYKRTVLNKIGIGAYKAWKENVVSPELALGKSVEQFAALDNIADILGFSTDFSLDRGSFESFAEEYLEKLPELVKGCLEKAGFSGTDIDLVLLTGGHSRWYFVKDLLCGQAERFEDCCLDKIKADSGRIISISLPQETVALGLVYSMIQTAVETKEPENAPKAAETNETENVLKAAEPASSLDDKINDPSVLPLEQILEICVQYQEKIGACSSVDKLMLYCCVPKGEQILFAHDDTMLGSGKNGFVITDQGIYCRELWSKPVYTSFDKIRNGSFRINEYDDVYCGDKRIIYITGDKKKQGVQMAAEIHDALTLFSTFDPQKSSLTEQTDGEGKESEATPEAAGSALPTPDPGNEGIDSSDKLSQIREICAQYQEKLGACQDLEILRTNLNVPSSEEILFAHDDTLFHTGKNGFIITDRGFYGKEIWHLAAYTSFDEIRDNELFLNDMDSVYCARKCIIYYCGSNEAKQLAVDIQNLLRA